MPIRFRCAYCNQLMGIARRKAGTVVTCPTCSGQVVVPKEDAAAQKVPASAGGGSQQSPAPLFEQSDFEDLFGESPGPAAPPPPAPAKDPEGAWGTNADIPPFDVEPVDPTRAVPAPPPIVPQGIVLSPTRATVLTVIGILLLAVAFGAGLLVGHLML